MIEGYTRSPRDGTAVRSVGSDVSIFGPVTKLVKQCQKQASERASCENENFEHPAGATTRYIQTGAEFDPQQQNDDSLFRSSWIARELFEHPAGATTQVFEHPQGHPRTLLLSIDSWRPCKIQFFRREKRTVFCS